MWRPVGRLIPVFPVSCFPQVNPFSTWKQCKLLHKKTQDPLPSPLPSPTMPYHLASTHLLCLLRRHPASSSTILALCILWPSSSSGLCHLSSVLWVFVDVLPSDGSHPFLSSPGASIRFPYLFHLGFLLWKKECFTPPTDVGCCLFVDYLYLSRPYLFCNLNICLFLTSHWVRVPWSLLSEQLCLFSMAGIRIFSFRNFICVVIWLMSIYPALPGHFIRTSLVSPLSHFVSSGSNTILSTWYFHLPCWIKTEL